MNPTDALEKDTPEKTAASRTAQPNPLQLLQQFGQSVWLDYIRRDLLTSGALQRLIDNDGLRGMTSNPAIFEKAITGSPDYAAVLAQFQSQPLSPSEIYERIAVRDIQDAADLLLPVYQSTKKRDGYVSLEVSPTLARDTKGSIAEARRLWTTVGRPNIMIKIPGTPEGVPAIRQLISEGININVTLLFAQDAYVKVAEAYIDGIEALHKAGKDISGIASVASFFVSRIDSLVDSMIEERLKSSAGPKEKQLLQSLLGKTAIANAKQAYWKYNRVFSGPRWKALADQGAQTQRLLWASTSTKNLAYRDVMYVEGLIGPDTVDTIPPATLDAFRDHGIAGRTLDSDLEAADKTMADLEVAGINMHDVTDRLLEEGIKLFADAFTKLLAAVQNKKTGGA
ncbi:MAG TPA: transaldolase [Verrucomicrobiae bacterium]|jgi:transaldolase/glucose-6-phosphate isomerase|nr:transaldolase [Verrucomicrobiae bacterium]